MMKRLMPTQRAIVNTDYNRIIHMQLSITVHSAIYKSETEQLITAQTVMSALKITIIIAYSSANALEVAISALFGRQ
jgi:hypothetical protein